LKQFHSIEKIDTGILYTLELTSSLSILLLAFGLIASMANVLTKGSVLTDNITMQRIWAWTQCIAIEASVAGTIIRIFRYRIAGERVKTWLHGLLSLLLLFTAAIVSNIESVQQMLNVTLDQAYIHVFIPVEALIWIRSFAIVLLIVAHALRHVQHQAEQTPSAIPSMPAFSPELVEALRVALAQVTVSENVQLALLAQSHRQETNAHQEREQKSNEIEKTEGEPEQEASNFERVKAYLAACPNIADRDIADALKISVSTANKWKKRVMKEVRIGEG
jgi:hypothetical protein